jgi:hypothetical protein
MEETLVPVTLKANISPMQSALSFGQAAPTEHQRAFGGEPKANVVGGHGMRGDIRNQSSGQKKAMESAMEGWTDKPARPPGQNRPAGQEGYGEECNTDAKDSQRLHQSGNQSSGQSKTIETTPTDQINVPMLLSDRCGQTGQESAAFDQQKGREFSEVSLPLSVLPFSQHICLPNISAEHYKVLINDDLMHVVEHIPLTMAVV